MSRITLRVNGTSRTVDVDPATPLLFVLKGQAVRSCITPVSTVGGAEITTLEGLGTPERPHPIQQAFIDEQAVQCGFCLSGVVLTAKAFLDRNPKADETQIRQAMLGVLCRCGANARMLKAITRYARGGKA